MKKGRTRSLPHAAFKILRFTLLLEIQQKREAHGAGERMPLLQGIDIGEVDPDEAVPNARTEGEELAVAVVRVFVEVPGPGGKLAVVPVFQPGPDDKLIYHAESCKRGIGRRTGPDINGLPG